MTELKNDRLIRALLRQPVDRTPVWIMRQAGRYLPEYRATRDRAGSFMKLCQTPELACEVTLQPLARFPLDAAILFSDILTIPDAMGLELYFTEGEGPKFKHPVRDAKAVAKLGVPDPEKELRYVMDAVRLVRRELNGKVPLIGFAGSPWTLATYMIEGASSREFNLIKDFMRAQPAALHQLLTTLTSAVGAYLNAQIQAGAQAVMIFDTWGGVLQTQEYMDYSLQYMQRIVQQLTRTQERQHIPVILFTKGGGQWLEQIAASGCDAVGVDWTVSLHDARLRIKDKVALQGNLDPAILLKPADTVIAATEKVLADYGRGHGHVFNLGHGITPEVSPENVMRLIETVHNHSSHYHQ
ncbi:MAG TPA: uroporphyrinogen decarboxylase [Gammaproteobacteria bacterium]